MMHPVPTLASRSARAQRRFRRAAVAAAATVAASIRVATAYAGLVAMSVRRLLVLSSLVLGVAALSPAATLGAANGTDRPVQGAVSAITTLNVATGAVTENASGELSHLGAVTIHVEGRSSKTGISIAAAGTSTLTAANGDQLFATFTATGTFTSTTTIELTFVATIVGGTGRFADASGVLTISASSVVVSIVGPNVTTQDSGTFEGQISY